MYMIFTGRDYIIRKQFFLITNRSEAYHFLTGAKTKSEIFKDTVL